MEVNDETETFSAEYLSPIEQFAKRINEDEFVEDDEIDSHSLINEAINLEISTESNENFSSKCDSSSLYSTDLDKDANKVDEEECTLKINKFEDDDDGSDCDATSSECVEESDVEVKSLIDDEFDINSNDTVVENLSVFDKDVVEDQGWCPIASSKSILFESNENIPEEDVNTFDQFSRKIGVACMDKTNICKEVEDSSNVLHDQNDEDDFDPLRNHLSDCSSKIMKTPSIPIDSAHGRCYEENNDESNDILSSSDISELSEEQSDNISCGFPSLKTIVFEKCKYRSPYGSILSSVKRKSASVCGRFPVVDQSTIPQTLPLIGSSTVPSPSSVEGPSGIIGSSKQNFICEGTVSTGCCKQENIDVSLNLVDQTTVSQLKNTVSAPTSPLPLNGEQVVVRTPQIKKCVRRRVSFPEDDRRLITSYLEPVDPWECMNNSTREDVLKAYIDSSKAHNCPPIPSVVQQISALPLDIPGRVERFLLNSCNFDKNQCEVLEEVFKRVQFVRVDLENCSLSDETLIPLLDMIEFYDSATQFNISCNKNIQVRGWQACARMLKKSHSVQYLDAHDTNIGDYVTIFTRSLKVGSKLRTLHLENCNLSGKSLMLLASSLKFNDSLVKLYLADNGMGINDGIHLNNLLKTNLTLKLLDLRNNNLQDNGCAFLCEGITEQGKVPSTLDHPDSSEFGLNALVLWNNHLSKESANHLAKIIMSTKSLETLNIGRNSLKNAGIFILKDALLRNRTIKQLFLHANLITDEGAVAIAEFIAESKSIERIDLRDNAIGIAGLLALSHSLKLNSSVMQIDLDPKRPNETTINGLIENHVNLLQEIDETVKNNRKNKTEGYVAENINDKDYFKFDPDLRKLSLVSEMGKLVLSKSFMIGLDKNPGDEGKKYRSPSPSPCPSPVPASPALSPLRSRFRVSRAVPHDPPSSPVGSPMISSANTFLGGSNNIMMCSSAPGNPSISTTSRPVVYEPGRNRFASGGRFKVTPVSDIGMKILRPSTSSIMSSSMSTSLPFISQERISEYRKNSLDVHSPQIIISSPFKIERGFSLDGTQESIPANILSKESSTNDDSETACSQELDSSSSDDVFLTSSSNACKTIEASGTESNTSSIDISSRSQTLDSSSIISESCSEMKVVNTSDIEETIGKMNLSPRGLLKLSDSGFLDENNTAVIESSVPAYATLSENVDHDGDSLFSNNSDGNSSITSIDKSDPNEDATALLGSNGKLCKFLENTQVSIDRAPLAMTEESYVPDDYSESCTHKSDTVNDV